MPQTKWLRKKTVFTVQLYYTIYSYMYAKMYEYIQNNWCSTDINILLVITYNSVGYKVRHH